MIGNTFLSLSYKHTHTHTQVNLNLSGSTKYNSKDTSKTTRRAKLIRLTCDTFNSDLDLVTLALNKGQCTQYILKCLALKYHCAKFGDCSFTNIPLKMTILLF